MSKLIEEYKELERKLLEVREKNNDQNSKEEEDILDKMDIVWFKMSEDELAEIDYSILHKESTKIFFEKLCKKISKHIEKTGEEKDIYELSEIISMED